MGTQHKSAGRSLGAIGAGLAALIAVPLSANAVSISFQEGTANSYYPGGYNATGDNQILGYGGFETANVGARNTVQLGTGSPGGLRRVILRFDGLGVMAGSYASIDSAQIVLKKASGVDQQYPSRVNTDMYQISDANANWVEGNGVFATALAGESAWNYRASPDGWAGSPGLSTAGVDTGAAPLSTVNMGADDPPNTTYTYNLPPSLVNQWITGVNGGVMLKFADEALANAVEIYASEFGALADAPVRPKLVIDYTPIPEPAAAVVLGLAGAIELAFRRRRR